MKGILKYDIADFKKKEAVYRAQRLWMILFVEIVSRPSFILRPHLQHFDIFMNTLCVRILGLIFLLMEIETKVELPDRKISYFNVI